jgi:hypothetical protein
MNSLGYIRSPKSQPSQQEYSTHKEDNYDSSSTQTVDIPYHNEDAEIGEITGTPLNEYMPQGWTALRIGIEGEGMCGIHSVNYALNTRRFKTIIHRGCPTRDPCSHHADDQEEYFRSPNRRDQQKAIATYAMRKISRDTRRLVGNSFTPSTARCALDCFKEQHCPHYDPNRPSSSREFQEQQATLHNVYRWLTETAFRQMAYILDMDILIFDHDNQQFNCGFRGHRAGEQPLLCINWIDGRHFEAICFVYNLSHKMQSHGNDLSFVVEKYAYTVVPRPSMCLNRRQFDADNDEKKSLCILYRSLYETRATQCANALHSNAGCRTNRKLSPTLPRLSSSSLSSSSSSTTE